MSLKELESIISQLEQTKSKTSGGKTSGAGLSGGKRGRKKKCKCNAGGELLDNVEVTGSGLEGGEILTMDGSGLTAGNITDFSGAGKKKRRSKKCGSGLDDMAGNSQGGRLSAGRTAKGTIPPQLKNWLSHVADTRAKHPGTAYKEILQIAKQSFH